MTPSLTWTDQTKLYETAFCAFLAGLAYLYRDNPVLIYPQVFWTLLALLVFNLVIYRFLCKRGPQPRFAPASILTNAAIVTVLLHYSGGKESHLWPAYLLPILTCALFLEGRAMMLCTLSMLALNGLFYLDFRPSQDLLPLSIKAAVLISSAWATFRASSRERAAQEAIQVQRKDLDRLTAQRHLSEALEVQDDRTARLGRHMAAILHDLNNPLTGILGFTQLSLTETPKDTLLYSDLKQVESLSKYCKLLVDNVAYLTQKQEYRLEDVDLRESLGESLPFCEFLLRDRRIELVLDFEKNLPPVRASRPHLGRVWVNLLMTASQLAPDQGTVSVQAKRSPTDPGKAEVSIRQEEAVVPDENLQGLFEPSAMKKTLGRGTALGLYLCKEIIERHHGRVRAHRPEKRGICLTFELPLLPKVFIAETAGVAARRGG